MVGSGSSPATATAALSGLQDHLKLAREYALEGLYETSIIFFDGAIAQINKYLNSHTLVLSLSLSASAYESLFGSKLILLFFFS